MSENATLPPIVLVHGLWMTPSSWDTWAERFRARGHEVIVPGWPGIDDREPADVRRDPSALENVSITEIVDSYDRIIRALPEAPIIMGHSFGGIFIQMLLDRGLGVAGVGVEPGQPAGVLTLPFSTLRTGLPILANPFGKAKASPLSKAHFHYTFGNDLSRADSDLEWEASAVNSVNRVFFEGVLSLPQPKSGITRVDFAKADRAPLLLISGEIDHVAPPAIQRATLQHYEAGPALVEQIEFPGRTHRIVSQEGWEEVADYALDWALEHARPVPDGATAEPAAAPPESTTAP
ncbi:alpha/beta hydrolase [Agromyces seonyuensis]|uniref:Alpha/beta fold hydrolase n=1 Tax=Agromyces seonyuensis TaxID=2662446 RepID=A0A6I4P225_9MICO|nr:alpha/beta hydrolase [Agromyces seonyuensis]MWB98795.1 alpha/beta fold hydrolase [Agromyces seonyuensis]